MASTAGQMQQAAKAYQAKVDEYRSNALALLLPGYMAAKGYGQDKKSTRKAREKLEKELGQAMSGIINSGDVSLYGTIDQAVPLPAAGLITRGTEQLRITHGQLYGATAALYQQYGAAPFISSYSPSTITSPNTNVLQGLQEQTKKALDDILSTISQTATQSVSESETSYLNRKDEISKLRIRGIGRYLWDSPLAPVNAADTGELDVRKLEGK